VKRGDVEVRQAEIAQQVAGLQLAARRLVSGVLVGLHRSVHRGGSAEFAEYAEYAPGDDPRTIDWKSVAKTDRWFVKRYEDTTNRRCYLLLDGSASMALARGGRASKADVARLLLAALAALLLRQGDAVAATVLRAGREVRPVPARGRSGHLQAVLERLVEVRPRGRTDLAAALDELGSRIPRRSLVALASDLVDDPARAGAALRRLAARGHEIVLLQVLDDDEVDFPFLGTFRFRDPETGAEVAADARVVADGYRRELAAFVGAWESEAAAARAELLRVRTGEDPARPLLSFLVRRRGLTRRATVAV
jgi:uncharacterized protein (DUF58 family)